jgi:hypothetical protein
VYREATGDLTLLIDGKADASTSLEGDMRTQLLLGHLPALLAGAAAGGRGLVIGLGSGVTTGALLSHPLGHVDVVEIEPEVVAAARRYFADVNRHALDDPRVELRIGDGRNAVARARDRYDMITSEPSNLWVSGVTSLFTAEFFAAAAQALHPGGVLCQWMHLYQVSPSDVRTVLRGLLGSFPHVRAFLDGPDLLVIASLEPLPQTSSLTLSPATARDLASVGIAGIEGLLALDLGDERALRAFAGPGPLHSDDRPLLEYSAPLSLAVDRSAEIAALLRAAAAAP